LGDLDYMRSTYINKHPRHTLQFNHDFEATRQNKMHMESELKEDVHVPIKVKIKKIKTK